MNDQPNAYELGRRHGYEAARAELLRILRDRGKAGDDFLPWLSLIDQLDERRDQALGLTAKEDGR